MNAPARSQARSAARLAAVQALYQMQMEGTALAKLLDEFHQHRLGREVDDEDHEGEVFADAEVDFFDDVVSGVDARRVPGLGRRRGTDRRGAERPRSGGDRRRPRAAPVA